MVPGVGAVVGGTFDLVETRIIANRAYKWFLKGDFSTASDNEDLVEIGNIGIADQEGN